MLAAIRNMLARPQFLRHGAISGGTLEKESMNHSRNFSKDNCRVIGSEDCPIKSPPPDRTKTGKESIPCVPDCRGGIPNLPARACLPWEKISEACPNQPPPRIIQSRCCEHICEPYVGQGIVDRLKMSVCEYRRFQKCFMKHGNAEKCMGHKLTFEFANKIQLKGELPPLIEGKAKCKASKGKAEVKKASAKSMRKSCIGKIPAPDWNPNGVLY
ncbi:uncharacterized protein LOC115877301 [Sitophilus oryzae]|uniref:Uncharacterized protein LOC115877301 n=1 Tax=Sitophilus oryzae TaxID=7048 RepID=A0A6J2XEV4_SITOR|nr:uncharacterized protein LOC115877301 [Sitophilus oryzae]